MSRRIGLILSILIAACSSTDDADDGKPSALVVAQASPIEATVGASVQVSVRLVDASQHGVAGVTIRFVAPAGALQSATASTGSDGLASVTWLLPATPGIITLTASADGVDPLVVTAKVASTTGATVALSSGDPAGDGEGFATDSVITVVAIDAYGLPIVGQAVSFAPDGSSGTTSAASAITDVSGKASVIWRLSNADAIQHLTVTTAGVPPLVINAVPLQSPTPREVAISPVLNHACRIGAQGAASCWGTNDLGELGAGDKTTHQGPVAVVGGRQYTSLVIGGASAATAKTCALSTVGATWCWGPGLDGGGSDSPVLVVDVPRLRVLTMGDAHLCGLDSSGFAWCWGTNSMGQLGVGDLDARATPARVSSTLRFQEIAAGRTHTCALAKTGVVYCWGRNNSGQIGDGTTTNRTAPQLVNVGAVRFTTLDAGASHNCAIAVGRALYCWGSNGNGRIRGDGVATNGTLPPTQTQAGSNFSRVFAGWASTCGVRADGTSSCWGDNSDNELADPIKTQGRQPGPLAGGFTFREIRVGANSACGVTPAAEVRCWGHDGKGVLGRPPVTSFTAPQAVIGGHTFTQIATAFFHSCGLESDGSTWCWGRNFLGALGNANDLDVSQPTRVSLAPPFKAIAAGAYTTCGIDLSGVIWCWGDGSGGQIGDGFFSGRTVPTRSIMPAGMTAISLGYYTACAIAQGGVPWCWGVDGQGTAVALPAPVSVPEAITDISVGATLAMARGISGTAYWWPQRFGVANNQARVVTGAGPVSAVAVGNNIGCVVTVAGNGYCDFQGNGAVTPKPAGMSLAQFGPAAAARCGFPAGGLGGCWGPADALSNTITTPFAQIASSLFDNGCGLTVVGAAYCWGNAQHGELGNGLYAYAMIPVLVP